MSELQQHTSNFPGAASFFTSRFKRLLPMLKFVLDTTALALLTDLTEPSPDIQIYSPYYSILILESIGIRGMPSKHVSNLQLGSIWQI